MRWAALLTPVAAAAFLTTSLVVPTKFAFSQADVITLTFVFVAGSAFAFAVYVRGWITIRALEALWNLNAGAIAFYAALLFVPAFLFDSVFLARFYVGVLFLPFLAATWMMLREHRGASRLARAFPVVFGVMAAVPGFVLPPYYQGIAGWITDYGSLDTVTLAGFKLVNDEGERIWVTHTIFGPVTQVGRFLTAWNDKRDELGPIEPFIMMAYRRAYPWLKEGYMSHQRFLGRLAYPPHTYATNLPDHTAFPPERIKRIEFVWETYARDGELVDSGVRGGYDVPE